MKDGPRPRENPRGPVAELGLGLDDPGFWWNYGLDKFVMLLRKKENVFLGALF